MKPVAATVIRIAITTTIIVGIVSLLPFVFATSVQNYNTANDAINIELVVIVMAVVVIMVTVIDNISNHSNHSIKSVEERQAMLSRVRAICSIRIRDNSNDNNHKGASH